mgnify:CR=1 FL=1
MCSSDLFLEGTHAGHAVADHDELHPVHFHDFIFQAACCKGVVCGVSRQSGLASAATAPTITMAGLPIPAASTAAASAQSGPSPQIVYKKGALVLAQSFRYTGSNTDRPTTRMATSFARRSVC